MGRNTRETLVPTELSGEQVFPEKVKRTETSPGKESPRPGKEKTTKGAHSKGASYRGNIRTEKNGRLGGKEEKAGL